MREEAKKEQKEVEKKNREMVCVCVCVCRRVCEREKVEAPPTDVLM